MVTRVEKLTIGIQFEITRPVAAIKSLRFALLLFFCLIIFFLKLIVACKLCVIYVREDNDSNV